MKIIYLVAVVSVLLVTLTASQTTDYCNKELCKKYTAGGGYYYDKHIACKNNGGFSLACPSERTLAPMTTDLINLILQLHNEYRLKIATGRVERYAKATQMIEMSWNSELAKLAELHVKACTFDHDKCRSTVQFIRPGQNIGITKSKKAEYRDVIEIVHNHTAEWFIEYQKCDMSYIKSYKESRQLIGHFTQLVLAGADRVGCAMSKYSNGATKSMLFTCNYSLGNLFSKPVYATGEPCSKCKSGCSKSYPGLCNTNEKDKWTKEERDSETTA